MGFHDRVQDAGIAGFGQIRAQEDRQPHAVVGMRHLVDVFQLGAFHQQNAVRHCAAGFLLRQGMQQRRACGGWLQIGHAHMVLQIVARLRIGGQAIDVAVIEHLTRQPVVDQIVQCRIGCCDLHAPLAGLQIVRILTRGLGKAGFGQVART